MLAEAAMMIPDTRQRLEKAVHELQSTMVSSHASQRSAYRHEAPLIPRQVRPRSTQVMCPL